MSFEKMMQEKTGVSISSKVEPVNPISWEDLEIIEQGENGNYPHQKCPKCNKKSLLTDKVSGDYFCEHCRWEGNIFASKLSQKFNKDKQNFERSWWKDIINPEGFYQKMEEKYSIYKETLDNLGIKYQKHYFSNQNKLRGSLVVPAYSNDKKNIINYYFLPLDKESNILYEYTESLNSNIIGLNSLSIDIIRDDKEDEEEVVYIANSVLDYIILNQTYDNNGRIICIPPNIDVLNFDDKKEWEFLTSIEKQIFSYKKFVTLFTQSEKNEKIKNELSRRIGLHSCAYIDFSEYKDVVQTNGEISILDIFKEGYEESVRAVMDKPTNYPIQGLHQLMEYEEEIDDIFENGLTPGYSWGYEQLDKHLTLKFGQWTLVTGIPGHGKSSFVEACLINMAYLHNFKIAMFSPENTPLSRFYISMIQKASGKSYRKDEKFKGERIEKEEHEYWKNWINERFFSILPEENMTKTEDFSIDKGNTGNMTLSGILSLGAKAVFRHGIKILVIDPWTEVEHQRPNGMTELEYLSRSISLIKMFAKSYNIHVIVVAHPTKILTNNEGVYPIPTPYNIAGGAHWRNKGDNIFTVYRNVGKADEDITDVFIQKIRFAECGQVGSFSIRADKITNFYYDDINQAKRIELLSRRFSPNSNSETNAISEEEMLSSSMRLTRNYNLRELPKNFQTKNMTLGQKVITTDYSYQEKPPF